MTKDRLNRDEQTGLLNIAAIVSLAKSPAMNAIRPYVKMLYGGNRDLACIETKAWSIFERLLKVIPQKALLSLQPTIKALQIKIGVPTVGSNYDKEFGMVVSYEDLSAIVEGCQDKCMMCDLPDAKLKDCPLRKAFSHLPTQDEPDPLGGGCGYRRLLIADTIPNKEETEA